MLRILPLRSAILIFVFSLAVGAGSLSPIQFLDQAMQSTSLNEKIVALRSLIRLFPANSATSRAHDDLISLLAYSNRTEEAFQEYVQRRTPENSQDGLDFTYFDYLLRTGRYGQLLRETSIVPNGMRDFIRDEQLMELRVQALLAQGRYQIARQAVEQFLEIYAGDGIEGSRFEGEVRSIQFLDRHLRTLERRQGVAGKPLFTGAVPDSLRDWSHRTDVPVVYYKLLPAHPSGQLHEPLLAGRHEGDDFFMAQTVELNRGFSYISGGKFSLKFEGVHTLYVQEGGVDPMDMGGRVLTSRVYLHTIPQLYRLAGKAYVVLIDFRQSAESEAAYMGDGLIHVSASHFNTMVLMHEILHGLGATHQDWNTLVSEGYKFDPDDRGLMTFGPRGSLQDFGLEEKNRAVLGWPRVPLIHLSSETASLPVEKNLIFEANTAEAPQDAHHLSS
jgi:hypothetical protein